MEIHGNGRDGGLAVRAHADDSMGTRESKLWTSQRVPVWQFR